MKYIWCILLAFSLGVKPCFSDNQNWIPIKDKLSSTCLSLEVIESNTTSYKIKVRINKLNDKIINKNGMELHQLSFDNDQTLQNIGEPALPVITQFIGMPFGSDYTKKITEEVWTDIHIGKIYPTQKPYVGESKDTAFVIKENIYKNAYYKQNLLTESEMMTWKGIDNVILTICPFKYYPSEKKLSVLSEFTLIINFANSKSVPSKTLRFEEKDLEIFSNKNFISAKSREFLRNPQTRNIDDYDYLIIVGNMPEIENSQAMKDFRRWKALKGHKTKLVSTSSIGTDSASIKNYIIQEYANGIGQVLFVGDHTKIPLPVFRARKVQSDHPVVYSDYWYGCVDGDDDCLAEIPIGRFVANNLVEFTNMVNKTIKYESLQHNWTKKVLLSAHHQNDDLAYFQGPMDEIRAATYSHPMSFITAYGASVENGGNDATAAYIYNYINNGINIVAHNGHGTYEAWWLGPHGRMYDVDFRDVDQMNDDTYSVFVSMACRNGGIYWPYGNILASFTQSDHCAVAFLGHTVPAFVSPGNTYIKLFFSALLNEGKCNLGELNLYTNLQNLNQSSYPNIAIDNAFSLLCGGDPSMEIWTGVQNNFNQPSFFISGGNITISVENADNFNVNIVSADGMLLGKYNSQNESTITIPLPNVDCDIALDKHNYIPYVIHFGTQYIQNETITGDAIYTGSPTSIGYDVTTSKEFGNVIIEPNAKVKVFKQNNEVIIKNGFECKQGAEFVVE